MSTTRTTDNENGVALVQRGYEESTRCLDFRVRFWAAGDGPACALAALRAIGSYNNFDGWAVAQALEPFAEKCVIAVGREGSPVVYVEPRYGNEGVTKAAIEAALRDVNADELDWQDKNRTLRAWWD
jgi:hypothetical protein